MGLSGQLCTATEFFSGLRFWGGLDNCSVLEAIISVTFISIHDRGNGKHTNIFNPFLLVDFYYVVISRIRLTGVTRLII